jgi:hypothetical protein
MATVSYGDVVPHSGGTAVRFAADLFGVVLLSMLTAIWRRSSSAAMSRKWAGGAEADRQLEISARLGVSSDCWKNGRHLISRCYRRTGDMISSGADSWPGSRPLGMS